ncbi:MAG TPA: oxygenase MpaB family protein [Candidatus Methylomirabilis sp.]|nr:oxygenase MpaB family protein [Candidatus Methylomirabilis sp.]
MDAPPSPTWPDDHTNSVVWKLHREIVLLGGWGRAILLQVAHPLVARGVADHTSFRNGRGEAFRRLQRTLQAMLTLTFGAPEEAEGVARIINGIHDRVHGTLSLSVGRFPAGTRYSAHDPALLSWVHATLLDSFLLTYDLFVGPLTAVERDRYCEESCGIESRLGIPPGTLPRSTAQLREYLDDKLSSGEVTVTDTARRLASDILNPPGFVVARPLLALARLPTIGLLPPAVRAGYGLSWSPRDDRALRAVAAVSRRLLPLLPDVLRYWPAARAASARAQARQVTVDTVRSRDQRPAGGPPSRSRWV